MKLNEQQRKNLERRRQLQRDGKGKTLKEAMASAGGGLLLQEILMEEERKKNEASDQASPDDPPTKR